MRASICYLSFLLCALPALSAEYRIRSHKTGACISNVGTHDRRVVTLDCHGPSTIVNVHADINPVTSAYGPVSSHGWFIGRSENGEYLEWVRKDYNWEFPPVHGTPFHTVHVRGHDDYWVDSHGRVPVSCFLSIKKVHRTDNDDVQVKLGEEKQEWYFQRV
ncbi:hypothetical protein APHAL10511_006904 [Amanita phalloides]|nr:hypothetical protein APHAL10511_006904 [Amanita phalloides]